MSVYVDPQASHGFRLGLKEVPSCHLFADTIKELEKAARNLKLQKRWRHKSNEGILHYDLSPNKRVEAIWMGAIEVSCKVSLAVWRKLLSEQNAVARPSGRALSFPGS